MRKVLFTVFLLVCIALGAYGGLWWNSRPVNLPSATPLGAQAVLDATPPIPYVLPTILEIPTLHVNVTVERVGLDSQNRMDVPQNVYNTGWYELGVKPGELGGALIAGHLDDPQGKPSVFYRLNTLNVGDKIILRGEDSTSLTFTVYDVNTYDFDKVPMGELMKNDSERGLHLITCGGEWDAENKNYRERTVVSARIVEQ